MARNLTYFISDLHLGASYIKDPHKHERIICRWLRSIAPTARTIYMLGDVLDYWYEYKYVVPRGFTRFFGTLAELTDNGVEVVWLKGNHDIWIFDYLPSETGVKVIDGAYVTDIDGSGFLMEHGDGVGEMRLSYRLMHSLFRARWAQVLFSAIHPRWTVNFAHRWSGHSRATGTRYTQTVLDDNDKLMQFVKSYSKNHPEINYYVFGHRHVVVDQKISPTARILILGDCYEQMTYGVWNGEEFFIKKMKTE